MTQKTNKNTRRISRTRSNRKSNRINIDLRMLTLLGVSGLLFLGAGILTFSNFQFSRGEVVMNENGSQIQLGADQVRESISAPRKTLGTN